jgi:hypothetical protein
MTPMGIHGSIRKHTLGSHLWYFPVTCLLSRGFQLCSHAPHISVYDNTCFLMLYLSWPCLFPSLLWETFRKYIGRKKIILQKSTCHMAISCYFYFRGSSFKVHACCENLLVYLLMTWFEILLVANLITSLRLDFFILKMGKILPTSQGHYDYLRWCILQYTQYVFYNVVFKSCWPN